MQLTYYFNWHVADVKVFVLVYDHAIGPKKVIAYIIINIQEMI